jgi:hypothetical protein
VIVLVVVVLVEVIRAQGGDVNGGLHVIAIGLIVVVVFVVLDGTPGLATRRVLKLEVLVVKSR